MGKQKHANQPSEFNDEVYRIAAHEHATALTRLYDSRQYVQAAYFAGVAVEGIFRAYRFRIDPIFDSRHNLNDLYKACKFVDILPAAATEEYTAALTDVAVRWSNTHRYRSEQSLRAFLGRAGLDRGLKGDSLKENTRLLIHSATKIVVLGVTKWKN